MAQEPVSSASAPVSTLRPDSVVPPAQPARPARQARPAQPRAERPARPARSGRLWPVGVAVPVLLVVSALVAVAVREYVPRAVVATGSFDPAAGPRPVPGGAGAPSPRPTAQPSPTGPAPTTPAPTTPPPVAPPGYQVHDEAGYWVAVPKGWQTRTSTPNQRDWWGDLTRRDAKLLFVTIKTATTKPQSARAALAGYEKARQHSGTIFYHRIRLADRPRLAGASSAAELEFTDRDYAEGAQTWHYHTQVAAVVTPDHRLYTIEFMILHNIYHDDGTTEGDWQLAVPTVRKILGSFRLG